MGISRLCRATRERKRGGVLLLRCTAHQKPTKTRDPTYRTALASVRPSPAPTPCRPTAPIAHIGSPRAGTYYRTTLIHNPPHGNGGICVSSRVSHQKASSSSRLSAVAFVPRRPIRRSHSDWERKRTAEGERDDVIGWGWRTRCGRIQVCLRTATKVLRRHRYTEKDRGERGGIYNTQRRRAGRKGVVGRRDECIPGYEIHRLAGENMIRVRLPLRYDPLNPVSFPAPSRQKRRA